MSSLGISAKEANKVVIRNMEFATEDLSAAEALIRAREKRELMITEMLISHL